MIAEPPSFTGAVHENVTDVEVLLATVSIKVVGGSGTVRIVATMAIAALNVLLPTLLIAATLKL